MTDTDSRGRAGRIIERLFCIRACQVYRMGQASTRPEYCVGQHAPGSGTGNVAVYSCTVHMVVHPLSRPIQATGPSFRSPISGELMIMPERVFPFSPLSHYTFVVLIAWCHPTSRP